MSDDQELNQALKHVLGIALLAIGAYLLLSHIQLSGFQNLGVRTSLYSFRAGSYPLSVTTGSIFIPFILGIIWVFYDSSKVWGWLISGVSIVALILGVIMKMRLTMNSVSAFDMSVMLMCMFGGFGMFLAGLKKQKKEKIEQSKSSDSKQSQP